MTTLTYAFENQQVAEIKKYLDKIGGKFISQDNEYMPRTQDELESDLKEFVADINNGTAQQKSLSKEEFLNEVSKW